MAPKQKPQANHKEIISEAEVRHSGIPYKVRVSTAEEYWACLQRFVSFEEPDERLSRLCELSLKQIKYPSVSARAFSALPSGIQERVFCSSFGLDDGASSLPNRLLNLNLAFEDLDRYTPVTFEAWYRKWWHDGDGREIKLASSYEWLNELKLEPAQLHWLASIERMQLDFLRLSQSGDWQSDIRAQFLVACLSEFAKRFKTLTPETVSKSRICFRDMLSDWRSKLPGSFLPRVLLIVEGQTEALLLPYLTRCLGIDLDKNAVFVAPVGGAKQAARRYLELRDVVAIPIVVILDNDAGEESQLLREMLRSADRLHVLSSGEIEDVFDKGIIIELLNRYLQPQKEAAPITLADLEGQERRTVLLDRLWRERGLGNFDKVGFAKSIADGGIKLEQVPVEIKAIASLLMGVISRQ